MAVRTVSVELKMKISDFEAAAAKAGLTTRALGDEFDDLGKKSSKFSTTKPTREMQNFSRVINAALKDGKTGFESIQTAIDDTRTHIAKLRSQIRTGGGSDSIFGDLKQANKDLRTLENVFKDLGGTVAKDAGKNAAQVFMSNFGNIGKTLATPEGLMIGGAIAGVAAPVIIAALSAAVASGVGLGLIGAAALIQKNNPRIVAAVTDLRSDVVGVFRNASEPLVAPIADALSSIDSLVIREGPQLRSMFAAVAPDVQLVTDGVEKLATDLIPAVTKAAQSFAAALRDPAVQASLEGVEQATIGLFKALGDNPRLVKDGFIALDVTLGTTETMLEGLVIAASALGDALHYIDEGASELNSHAKLLTAIFSPFVSLLGTAGDSSKSLADAQDEAQKAIDAATQAAEHAGPTYQSLSQQINATVVTSDTLAGEMTDKLIGGMLGVDNATNNFNKSLVTLGDTIVAQGGHLTAHVKSLKKTETGQQQETDAVLAAIQANLQVYDSQIAVGISADDAAKAYDKNASSLEAQVKSAGKVPPAVQKLIDKYAKVPDKVNTTIAMQGLTDAIDNLNSTLLLLSHIDGFHANATVTTIYKTKGRPATGPLAQNFSRWGNIYEPAADGLLTHAQVYTPVNPGRFMIAEPQTKGEAFIPKNGDYGRSMSILSAAAGWYGAHVVEGRGANGGSPVVVNLYASDPGGRALVNAIRLGVQSGGGNVVKVLTPR